MYPIFIITKRNITNVFYSKAARKTTKITEDKVKAKAKAKDNVKAKAKAKAKAKVKAKAGFTSIVRTSLETKTSR